MNYVAHCLLAENESPEFRFGSMAPDLVAMAGCELQRIKSNEEREMLSNTELAVQAGIDFHILTDSIFNELPTFKLLKRKFRDEVAVNYFPKDLRLIRMFGDVGTELLLDGYVMGRWPSSSGLYRDTVSSVGMLAMGIATKNPKRFVALTREKQGRLPDYSDSSIVTNVLSYRVANHPKLRIGEQIKPNLARAFEDHKQNVWEYGESIFLETQARVMEEYVVSIDKL